MNGIVFLIPFMVLVGVAVLVDNTSYAGAIEFGSNYNKEIISTSLDGKQTIKQTFLPYERILDDGQYKDYIFTDLPGSLQLESNVGSISLNKSTCEFSFYDRGLISGDPLFTDSIATTSKVKGTSVWTRVAAVNSALCDATFENGTLSAKRIAPSTGTMEYKYIFSNGKWKTQLEITNTSPLVNNVFGFDQTVSIGQDNVKFGGVVRDIDILDGLKFGRSFIETGNIREIDFLNDFAFGFDLGFEYLDSITVNDTGARSSELVFHYLKNDEELLPGETLVIDPTFSYTAGTNITVLTNAQTGTACHTTAASTGAFSYVYIPDTATSDGCVYKAFSWDITSIGDSETITDVDIRYDIVAGGSSQIACDWNSMELDPNTSTSQQILDDIKDGTTFVSNDSNCVSIANDYEIDLGASADSDLQGNLASDEWSVGIMFNNSVRDGSFHRVDFGDVELQVTYTSVGFPDEVDDLTYTQLGKTFVNLDWTEPGLNGGTLVNYMVNQTSPWGDPTTFTANATSSNYNVTGLLTGTQYSFRVAALADLGYNAGGNILNVTTTPYAVSPSLIVYPAGTSTSQLNLEWTAPAMDNINGYRILREIPVGGGFSTLVANTTNTNTYYNNTGLSVNTYYNYKVYALNGTGVSQASNTYAQTTYHLSNSVDDLVATATDLSSILLDWTQPDTLYGFLQGYMINFTTPVGDPTTILVNSTGNSDTEYYVTGIDASNEYSFRVAAVTIHGVNATGNISNATAFNQFDIGDISLPAGPNPLGLPIIFNEYPTSSNTTDIQVVYDEAYDLNCDFAYKYGRTNQTYGSLTENTVSGSTVYTNFTLNNPENEIINIRCWNILNSTISANHQLSQSSVPLFNQLGNFQSGLYGTDGMFGALDLITLLVVIVSMIGFNRYNPAVGVILMVIMLGALSYYGIIQFSGLIMGVIALIVTLAIVTVKKN